MLEYARFRARAGELPANRRLTVERSVWPERVVSREEWEGFVKSARGRGASISTDNDVVTVGLNGLYVTYDCFSDRHPHASYFTTVGPFERISGPSWVSGGVGMLYKMLVNAMMSPPLRWYTRGAP